MISDMMGLVEEIQALRLARVVLSSSSSSSALAAVGRLSLMAFSAEVTVSSLTLSTSTSILQQ